MTDQIKQIVFTYQGYSMSYYDSDYIFKLLKTGVWENEHNKYIDILETIVGKIYFNDGKVYEHDFTLAPDILSLKIGLKKVLKGKELSFDLDDCDVHMNGSNQILNLELDDYYEKRQFKLDIKRFDTFLSLCLALIQSYLDIKLREVGETLKYEISELYKLEGSFGSEELR